MGMEQTMTSVDKKRFSYTRVLSNGWRDYERTHLLNSCRPPDTFLFNSFMAGFAGVMSFLNCPIYYDKQAYMEMQMYAKTRKGSKEVDIDTEAHFVSGVVYVFNSITIDGKRRNLNELCRKIHASGSVVLVDNTYATFLHIKPWKYGVDYTLESFTKYVTGHLDYMSGCLVLRDADLQKFNEWCVLCGLYASVETEHMVYIGLQTMKLRLQKIEENTAVVCRLLDEKHVKYHYPGIGGVLWLNINNPEQVVEKFKTIQASDTFGLNYTTWTIYEDNEVFLRLSVGIEDDIDDVLEDLRRSL